MAGQMFIRVDEFAEESLPVLKITMVFTTFLPMH